MFMIVVLSILLLDLCSYVVADNTMLNGNCPIWHIKSNEECKCGANLGGAISCDIAQNVLVRFGSCMTWDNVSQSVTVNYCPFSHQLSKVLCQQHGFHDTIEISTNVSGPELNSITCEKYNRQGTQCRQCRDGYGPAPFSDGFSCADCNVHTHLWVLMFLLQLAMVTLMYLLVILFQIKGTSCPLNIIITYCQLFIAAINVVGIGVHERIACYLGQILTRAILTIFGVLNLDFFHLVVPPMCVSSSFKSIDILLFDYIIGFYPIVLTLFIYIGVELHDRNCCMVTYITLPVVKLLNLLHKTWNPKTTILNTCITFILLAYSKIFSASINFLFAVRSYYSNGEVVPDSTVLFYDPTIRFFHSEHIPYAVLALSVIVILVVLPPLLLLLYPSRLFRRCLNCCGFQKWDILHLIADIFQGWYKDGTQETLDYRPLSSLYLLLRIAFCITFVVVGIFEYHDHFMAWYVLGTLNVLVGVFFLIAKPYRKNWMNYVDGLVIVLVGVLLLISGYGSSAMFLPGLVIALIVLILVSIVSVYTRVCIKKPAKTS